MTEYEAPHTMVPHYQYCRVALGGKLGYLIDSVAL